MGQTFKQRFGAEATPEQIIAGIGFLLCSLGTPCIYYGTEQGFNGTGENDSCIREAMFSLENKDNNSLDTTNKIYQDISKIAAIRMKSAVLKFGHMHMRKTSTDKRNFHLPACAHCLIAFSRVLFDQEILVAYNSSTSEKKTKYIGVKRQREIDKAYYRFLYGDTGKLKVLENPDYIGHYIQLELEPMQFVILSNS